MCSLKAFINENHSQKIAPWSTAIFPYFTALTDRKLSLGLTRCHKKKFLFTDPLFGQNISPCSLKGWEAIKAEFKALGFSVKYSQYFNMGTQQNSCQICRLW